MQTYQRISRRRGFSWSFTHHKAVLMTLKKIAICAAALVASTIASQLAQAGSKGTPNHGVSSNAPGQQAPVPGDPGKSGNAPGDKMHDSSTATNAKDFAPGQKNPNKK